MSEWQPKKVRELADTFAGGTPDRSRLEYFGGAIPWVKSTEVNLGTIRATEEAITELGLRSSAAKWIPAQSIVVALYGATAAQVAFLEIEATANQAVLAVVTEDQIDGRFLYYALSQAKPRLLYLAQGSGQPNLSKQIVDNLELRVPSPTTQRRIAEILSTLDEAIERTEGLIGKLQQIKAGLIHDLFTRGVTPAGHLRPPRDQAPHLYKPSPLGWIPNEWVTSNCADQFVIDSGITLGPHRRPNKTPHGYLRVGNVYRDRIVLEEIAQLEAAPGEVERGSLKTYDLLVVEGHANRNEIGRCAMVFEDAEGMLFQNHLFRLRATRVDPRYALLWLNSWVARNYWESKCATSSGLNTINRTLLARMPILVPSDDEQHRIVSRMFEFRDVEATNASTAAKLRHQKHGLMHDLLTGRVRVPVAAAAEGGSA